MSFHEWKLPPAAAPLYHECYSAVKRSKLDTRNHLDGFEELVLSETSQFAKVLYHMVPSIYVTFSSVRIME